MKIKFYKGLTPMQNRFIYLSIILSIMAVNFFGLSLYILVVYFTLMLLYFVIDYLLKDKYYFDTINNKLYYKGNELDYKNAVKNSFVKDNILYIKFDKELKISLIERMYDGYQYANTIIFLSKLYDLEEKNVVEKIRGSLK